MNEPVYRPQIGYDLNGRPVYGAWPAPRPGGGDLDGRNDPPAPLQPIKAHPWGAYLAGGCLGLLALTVVVVLVMFVVFGLTILATVLALTVVCLTICVLVLRDMWTTSRKER